MAAEGEAAGGLKTVQVDPAMLGLGGRGSRRTTSRKSNRVGRSRPTLRDSVSQVDIAAQSAALQAAVEQALATAGSAARGQSHLPPPPSKMQSDPDSTVSASETKTVSSSLGDSEPRSSETLVTGHPRSTTSVSTAVHELNKLMEERARARIRKTVRAQQRRAMAAGAGRKASQLPDVPEPESALTVTTDSPPAIPLVSGSTVARSPNDPPWGCLKGGSKLTYRNYRQTQRAARHPKDPAPSLAPHASKAGPQPKRRVRIRPSQPEVSTPAPGDVVTVGRQRSGKVAFVIGNSTRSSKRHNTKASGERRSVTNRARLRRAHLLKGGSNTPQRLVEVMAHSVDAIGEVERPVPT